MEELEDYRRGYPAGVKLTIRPVIRGKATIEHLMLQNWMTNWPANLTDAGQAERGQLVQSLGDLTLAIQGLTLGDAPYTTPSGAAASLVRSAINGWWFWVVEDGRTLVEVRSEYLASFGESEGLELDEMADTRVGA